VVDESIRFMPSGHAVVQFTADRDLGQWLCRQSAGERTSVAIFVLNVLRDAVKAHAKSVGAP
jgi:hypothetical protein